MQSEMYLLLDSGEKTEGECEVRVGSVMNQGQEVRWKDDVSGRQFMVHYTQILRLLPAVGIRGHSFKLAVTLMAPSF